MRSWAIFLFCKAFHPITNTSEIFLNSAKLPNCSLLRLLVIFGKNHRHFGVLMRTERLPFKNNRIFAVVSLSETERAPWPFLANVIVSWIQTFFKPSRVPLIRRRWDGKFAKFTASFALLFKLCQLFWERDADNFLLVDLKCLKLEDVKKQI